MVTYRTTTVRDRMGYLRTNAPLLWSGSPTKVFLGTACWTATMKSCKWPYDPWDKLEISVGTGSTKSLDWVFGIWALMPPLVKWDGSMRKCLPYLLCFVAQLMNTQAMCLGLLEPRCVIPTHYNLPTKWWRERDSWGSTVYWTKARRGSFPNQ